MHRSGLITSFMLAGLVLGVLFGVVIHDDLAAALPNAHPLIKPIVWVLSWVQTALGIEPFAKSPSPQFGFDWLRELGTLVLIRPLMLLIIPLVFVSVVLGVTSIGDPAKLGLIGGATILYYIATMLLAASLAAIIVSAVRPGDMSADQRHALTARAEADYQASDVAAKIQQAQAQDKTSLPGAWNNLIDQLIPTNIVKEMAEGRTLGVIVFALLFGLALAGGGSRTEPAITVIAAVSDAVLRLIGWVIWLAPIGVFLLVSWTVGRVGLGSIVGPLGKFMILVMAGLAFHGFVVLPVVLLVVGRTNPLRFTWRCRKALLTAFGTASSSATLPVTLEVCELEAGCSKRATNFVVPLGATINMNGTALFEAIAVVFLCQLYGIDLAFDQLVIVIITATLAAIGAAGIPAAGLVTMVIVINAVNLSLESSGKPTLPPSAIGVIVGVDRILDMCRTLINVWGDMVGAKIITQLAPDPAGDGKSDAQGQAQAQAQAR
jgi:solute carrier family 1 (high affinity glutamate transporter) protein 1